MTALAPPRWQEMISTHTDAQGREFHYILRKHGGHTSDYATKPLLLGVVRSLLAQEAIDVEALQSTPEYAPPEPPAYRLWPLRLMGRARRRVRAIAKRG